MDELKVLEGTRVNKNNNYITNDKKLIDQLKINNSTFELLIEDLLYPEYEVDTKIKKISDMYPCIFQRMYKNKDNLKKVGLVRVRNVNILEYLLKNKNDIVKGLLNDNLFYYVRDGKRISFLKNFTLVFIVD